VSVAAEPHPPRRLWITVPLYAVLLAVVGIDVWAFFFWVGVGGSLGAAVAGAAALVIVLATVLLATDARRQWLLQRDSADANV